MNKIIKTFDIIVGDFGRTGTLRYFNEFSLAEERAIINKQHSTQFFDEQRIIGYSLVGLLRNIKEPYIRKFEDSFLPIDETILVGYSKGILPDEIISRILLVLEPWVNSALTTNPQKIRIVVPCNTLTSALIKVRDILNRIKNKNIDTETKKKYFTSIDTFNSWQNALLTLEIDIPTIPEILLSTSISDLKKIPLIGTNSTIEIYNEVAKCKGLKIIFYSPITESEFMQLLKNSINGNFNPNYLINYPSNTINACTDLKIKSTIDSCQVFAESLVNEVYR
jgi:hypothetical protein